MSGGRWKVGLQAAASVVLFALAVKVAQPDRLVQAVRQARGGYLALSVALVPALIALRTLRWHILSRTRRPEMRFRESVHSYMAGLTLATVSIQAAELARGAYAAPDDKAGFMGLTLLDKIIDVATLYLFASAGLVLMLPGWQRAIGPAAAAAACAGWFAAGRLAAVMERRLPKSRITNAVGRALAAMRQVPKGVLAVAFLVAVSNLALYYFHLYLITYAFSPEIEVKAIGLFPWITLNRVIPSIGGVGVREFIASALFAGGRYKVSSAAAVNASLVQFVTLNVAPVVVWLAAAGGFSRMAGRRSGGKRD